jgi:arabinofuranosyltransferase
VLIHRLAPRVVGAVATRIGLVLTALYPPLVLWSMGGLETAAATLALTAGVLPLAKPAPGRREAVLAGAAFAVLGWLRPEGIAIAVAVVLTAEAPGLVRRSRAAGERLAIAVGLPLVAQAVLEASRLAIYGHLVPNSVIYKSGRGGAWEVASRFCHQAWPILALAAGGLLVARGRQRVLAVAPVVYLIGSHRTVASVDSFSRFFMPTWPLWALLAALAVATQAGGGARVRPSPASPCLRPYSAFCPATSGQ